MEPALIGVKSKQQHHSSWFCRRVMLASPILSARRLRFIFGLMKLDPDRGNRFFPFLRRMKAGGRTNMYGAVPYLMKAFGLDRNAAFAVICEWLDRQNESASVQPSSRPSQAADQRSTSRSAGQAGRRRRTI
jgi:hypothetical protein